MRVRKQIAISCVLAGCYGAAPFREARSVTHEIKHELKTTYLDRLRDIYEETARSFFGLPERRRRRRSEEDAQTDTETEGETNVDTSREWTPKRETVKEEGSDSRDEFVPTPKRSIVKTRHDVDDDTEAWDSLDDPRDGRSFHWRGGALRKNPQHVDVEQEEDESLTHFAQEGGLINPGFVTMPLGQLRILLSALSTHPPRILFTHHSMRPNTYSHVIGDGDMRFGDGDMRFGDGDVEGMEESYWNVTRESFVDVFRKLPMFRLRNFGELYPPALLRGQMLNGTEMGNYGPIDADVFNLDRISDDPEFDVCRLYTPPRECMVPWLTRHCLVASAHRWGGNSLDIYLGKHLRIGSVSMPERAEDVLRAAIEIACNPHIVELSADAMVHVESRGRETNDPFSERQWHIKDLNLPAAWGTSKGDTGVMIMIADTGVEVGHKDLKNNIWQNPRPGQQKDFQGDKNGIDAASGNGDLTDSIGHGTHMAGIVGAVTNNKVGVAGINWAPKIVGCKFISTQGGQLGDAAKCFDYGVEVGVKVISCSFGGPQGLPQVKTAIQDASNKGVVFAFSSGNGGQDNDQKGTYPANYASEIDGVNAVAVDGYTQKKQLIDYGSYGPKTVQLAAPGDYVYSTAINGNYEFRGGTSTAGPMIAGLMALAFSANPRVGSGTVVACLPRSLTKEPTFNGKIANPGRVDAARYLQCVKQ